MTDPALPIACHGPADAVQPLLLDSPHSGHAFPADFDAAVSEYALRDGEDCFVDELWWPATARGVPLLTARVGMLNSLGWWWESTGMIFHWLQRAI